MNDDILTKIGKLLALAEKASSEEEADAAMRRAQALSTKYQVELEVARQRHQDSGRRPMPEVRRIQLGAARTVGLSTYVELFTAVAHNNNVRLLIAHNSTVVWAHGFNDDIDMVELLYNSLITQMIAASTAYLRSGIHKQESVMTRVRVGPQWARYWDWQMRPVSTRTARISFQSAFAKRINDRLHAAQEEALLNLDAEAKADGLSIGAELILARRGDEVESFYDAEKKRQNIRGNWKGASNRASYSNLAAVAGREAGSKARLHPATPIGGHRTEISA